VLSGFAGGATSTGREHDVLARFWGREHKYSVITLSYILELAAR
jgi:hypothetical protein